MRRGRQRKERLCKGNVKGWGSSRRERERNWKLETEASNKANTPHKKSWRKRCGEEAQRLLRSMRMKHLKPIASTYSQIWYKTFYCSSIYIYSSPLPLRHLHPPLISVISMQPQVLYKFCIQNASVDFVGLLHMLILDPSFSSKANVFCKDCHSCCVEFTRMCDKANIFYGFFCVWKLHLKGENISPWSVAWYFLKYLQAKCK